MYKRVNQYAKMIRSYEKHKDFELLVAVRSIKTKISMHHSSKHNVQLTRVKLLFRHQIILCIHSLSPLFSYMFTFLLVFLVFVCPINFCIYSIGFVFSDIFFNGWHLAVMLIGGNRICIFSYA